MYPLFSEERSALNISMGSREESGRQDHYLRCSHYSLCGYSCQAT